MNRSKKKRGNFFLKCIFLICIVGCEVSCKEDNDTSVYNPSMPVVFDGFFPEEGGSTTQLIITGSNFGNDESLVKVKVGNRYAKVVGVVPTRIYAVVTARSVDASGDAPISVTIADNESFVFQEKFKYELTQIVSTLAGTGAEGTQDGNAMTATFANPYRLAIDKDGNLFIDEFAKDVRMLSAGGMVSTLLTTSRIYARGMCLSLTQDSLFLSHDNDTSTPCMYFLKRDEGFSVARGLIKGYSVQNNSAAVNPVDGKIFWNQYGDGSLYSASPSDVDGTFQRLEGFHSEGGSEVQLAWSPDGKTFYRIMTGWHIIYRRSYDLLTHKFIGDETVFCGQKSMPGLVNGLSGDSKFNAPQQAVADSDGNLYVCDTQNHVIRKITADGVSSIYAGNGENALVNGLPLKSSFNQPSGLAIDEMGVVYVADLGNHVIRKIVVE